MKKLQLVLLAAISFLFFVPQANATSFSFGGGYSFMDDDGDSDTFRETLHFSGGFAPNSGGIHPTDPAGDSIDMGSVLIADLTLDVTSYVSGEYFDFAHSPYAGGFKVYNSDVVAQMVMVADLAVSRLDITDSAGSINSLFSMNLTNIVAGGSYASGDSVIIDEFLAASAAGYGGATNLTLQFAGDLSLQIINAGGVNGSSFGSTYSGSAAPVPEPGTLLLLGAGLVGLAFSNRQRTKA